MCYHILAKHGHPRLIWANCDSQFAHGCSDVELLRLFELSATARHKRPQCAQAHEGGTLELDLRSKAPCPDRHVFFPFPTRKPLSILFVASSKSLSKA